MNKLGLKTKIKELAARGREIRKEIQKSSGLQRNGWWNEKRAVGSEARYYLLAYGFLRQMPYERMEPVGSSKPWTKAILRRIHDFTDAEEQKLWTEDRVKVLIEPPEIPVAKVAEAS